MKKSKVSLFEKRARYGYVFILPLILGAVMIFIPNLIQTVRYSVSEIHPEQGFSLTFSGFSSYKEAFVSDAKFIPLLTSSFKSLLLNVPIILIYSLFISTMLNQSFKGRVIARVIFFIPVILATGALTRIDGRVLYYTGAGQVIDTGMSSAASGFSDISSLLMSVNFPDFLVKTVVSAVDNIYTIACSSGLQIYIFLAGLQEIPASVYEAASIEGCSKWELFWKITFPMIAPQIAVNAIYTIAASVTSQNSLLDYTVNLAFKENNYSLATAMNIVYLAALSIFVLIVLLIIGKFSAVTEE